MFNLIYCHRRPLSNPPRQSRNIPDEIVIFILGFLSPKDIVGRASLISRQFRYLALHKKLWSNNDPTSIYQFQLVQNMGHNIIFPVRHKPTGLGISLYRHKLQYIGGEMLKQLMENKQFVLVTDHAMLWVIEYRILPERKRMYTIVNDELIEMITFALIGVNQIFEFGNDADFQQFCLVRIIHYLQENEKQEDTMLTIQFLIWALFVLNDKDNSKLKLFLQSIIVDLPDESISVQLKVISYLLYDMRRRELGNSVIVT